MANGRTLTKTRTRTTTRTATAVALGTVGLASIAAAALAFNFREVNSAANRMALRPSGGTTVPAARETGTTGGRVAVDVGGTPAANVPAPRMAPGVTASVEPLTAASCRSNPKDYPDLALGTGTVTRAGFGTTRGAVLIQILNNSDKNAGAFTLKCIEQLPGGRRQDLGSFTQSGLEGRRQRTQNVEFSPTAVRVQCFVDALDQIAETNECNNIKDFIVEAPI